MSTKFDFDVAVIGSGPAGYVSAIRASQLGLKVAIIEKDLIGGVCLNWGCIPSKALINIAKVYSSTKKLEEIGVAVDKSSFDYSKVFKKSRDASDRLSKGVSFLLNKNRVEVIKGVAKIIDKNTIAIDNNKTIKARNLIIATGSRPKELPNFNFDSEVIYSSDDLLKMNNLPDSIAIIGAGAIGVEFAYILNSFGVKVTLIEALPEILPNVDREVSSNLSRTLKKQGVSIITGAKVVSYEKKTNGVELLCEVDQKEERITVNKIAIATGRVANIENLGLEEVGVKTEKGFIKTGEYFQTEVEGIYAIGDVTILPKLAHVGSKAGEIVAEFIAGVDAEKDIDIDQIPFAVYCEPQVAGFGLTEDMAKAKSLNYKTSIYFYRANGKAVATESIEGLIKIIYEAESKNVLGCFSFGSDATEIVHEVLLAKKANLSLLEIADMIHAHPTLSEIVMESSKNIFNKAIHI